MDYFNRELDTISLKDLQVLQNDRLRTLVDRCYRNVPYYRALFDKEGLKPKHIQTTDDIVRIPFTEKKDLRAQYPFGFLGIPIEQIHRFAGSSGTTGMPKYLPC